MTGGIPHECNAWCRGNRHAVVAYIDGDHCPAAVERVARLSCERRGLTFVAVADAPEAPPPDPDRVWDRDWEASREEDVSLAGLSLPALLLIYDDPEDTR